MADLETSTSIPRRKAAQTASKVLAEQVDSDSQASGPEAEHDGLATGIQPPRKKFKYRKGYRSRKAASTKATKATTSGSRSSLPPQPDGSGLPPSNATSKNPSAELDGNDNGLDGLSDLTSISSDEQISSSDIVVTVASRKTALPKPFPLSVAQHSTSIPEASSSKVPRSNISKASTLISGSRPGRPRSSVKSSNLDTYVWVLIASDTGHLYDRETAQDRGLWWPGKIQNPHTTGEPIEVKLYGKGTLYIVSPAGNILPQVTQSPKLKFMKPGYVHPNNLPRKKKQKGEQDDMKKEWQAAVDEMKSDMKPSTLMIDKSHVLDLTSSDDEDLPLYVKPNPSSSKTLSIPPTTPNSQSVATSNGTHKRGKKRKRVNKDSDPEDSLTDVSVSLLFREQVGDGGEVDISLVIPGELVLGRSKNQPTVYWPARIDAYLKPSKSSLSGKYSVTFLDGTREDIPRDWFYSMVDPQFALCKLGAFISKDPNHVADDEDDEDVEEEDRSSPAPQDTPPSKEEFIELPIAQQFIYTKEILRAILNDTYAPSRQKHDDFVRGGKYRKRVTNGALLRGLMNAKDVERLHKIVIRWCLKNCPDEDELPGPTVVEDAEQDHQHVGTSNIPSEPVLDESVNQDIVMEEPSISNEFPEPVVSDSLVEELGSASSLTDYVHPESAIRFTSPSHTDKFVSSPPPEMPPSSNPLTTFEYASSQSDIQSVLPTHNPETVSSPPPSSFVPSVFAAESPSLGNDEAENLSELTPVEDEEEVTVRSNVPRARRVFVPFKSLTPLVRVEYCSNVLVPEAIRQILLWRAGERTQVGLLSPEQEQMLYDKGQELLVERDWVFDVMRLRERQIQKLKAESEKQGRKKNGSSSRPKRNVAAPNYVE